MFLLIDHLTRVVPDRGPLNSCVCARVCVNALVAFSKNILVVRTKTKSIAVQFS